MKIHRLPIVVLILSIVSLCMAYYVFTGLEIAAEPQENPLYLYLVQHADANKKEVDPERNLSKQGLSDINKVAIFFAKTAPSISVIKHSPLARAKQTAKILANSTKVEDRLQEVNFINWDSDIALAEKDIAKLQHNTMFVGHLPHLSKLAAKLLTNDENKEIVNFKRGGIVCLKKNKDKWALEWMVVPENL